jgi:alpha-ribazole phosphatase
MKRLFLIRHAETDGTKEKRFMGRMDLPLNETGIRQAESLALRLKGEEISAFYVSPMKRTFQTAKILNQFHKRHLRKRHAFKELDFGKWEGMTLDEIYKNNNELCRRWFSDLENFTMPCGESYRDMKERVISGWEKIRREASGATVAIVTHGGPIRIFLCHILKLDVSIFWKMQLDTSSLNIIAFSRGSATLTLLNGIYYK